MLILHEESGLIIFLSEKQHFLITSPESHVWAGPSKKRESHTDGFAVSVLRAFQTATQTFSTNRFDLKNKHFDDFANGAWQLILHIKVFFYMHSEKQKFSNLQSTTHLPGPHPDPDGESSARTADSAWLCLESVNTPRIHPAVQKGGYGTPRTIIRTPKSLEIWD